jgi:hypothetical protein
LAQAGVLLLAPYFHATRDPWPALSRRLSRLRDRIATVFGQLAERGAVKRLWARDCGHLARRLRRLVLMHTLAVYFTVQRNQPPLHLAALVA